MTGENTVMWPGWDVVRLIGKGSFGSVYEIRRDILGNEERAALKVITIPQNSSDIEEMYSEGYDEESITATFQEHLKSIVNEYALMRKLNGSANVVSCDDVRYIQHENGIGWDIYIKMELLTPLTRALPQQIPEETALRVGIDLCHALELCKKHDIIHRDIKPQNIFVSDNGDYKLGDFGIAKTVEKTMGGTKVGTYKYMAPEVYNNQPYGSAADIYSLGMVLYWLLNERRMPFAPLPPARMNAGDEDTARNRRLSGEPLPPPAHGSATLKQIVLKACAYNPKDRYTDPSALERDLEGLLMGNTPIPTPMPPKESPVYSPQEPPTEGVPYRYTEPPTEGVPYRYTEPPTEGVPYRDTKPTGMETPYREEEPGTTGGTTFRAPLPPKQNPKPTPTPTASKKNKTVIAIVAAVVVILVALVLFKPASTPANNSSASNYATARPTMRATAKPTAKPTAKATAKPTATPCPHQWTEATCTEKKTCRLCGITTGEALGHAWQEATYYSPKQCARCGETVGNVKGYMTPPSSKWSDHYVEFSTWWVYSKILDTPVMNCRYIEMDIWFSDIKSGSPYGEWGLYARYNSSPWEKVGTFELTEDYNTIGMTFSQPLNFTELALKRISSQPCDHLYNFELTFVQTY